MTSFVINSAESLQKHIGELRIDWDQHKFLRGSYRTGKDRSLDQNAKFHAICSDLARSPMEWAGKRRTAAQWKVLLVSGHAVATKEAAEIIPGLEGEFINVRESTALMSVKRGASLIEYCIAFCSENDIPISENHIS